MANRAAEALRRQGRHVVPGVLIQFGSRSLIMASLCFVHIAGDVVRDLRGLAVFVPQFLVLYQNISLAI